MKEDILKKALDEAELLGFDRGVKTICIELLKEMEKSNATAISYKSIKGISDLLVTPINKL